MENQLQTSIMHDRRFGKGQRFTDKARQALPKGIIPTLDMSGFSTISANSAVLLLWDHRLIGGPEIGEAMTRTIWQRDGLPQTRTGGFAAISCHVCHHLSHLTTERDPDPRLIRLF